MKGEPHESSTYGAGLAGINVLLKHRSSGDYV